MSAEQIGGVALMGMSVASTGVLLRATQGLMSGQTRLTQFDKPKPKARILRKNHKPVFRVTAYASTRSRNLVFPKRIKLKLPSTAISALGTFFHPTSGRTLVSEALKHPSGRERKRLLKASQVILPADTVRKMILG